MKNRLAVAFGLLTVLTAFAAWAGTELVMAPAGGERNRLIAMYAAIAASAFAIGVSLVSVTKRSLSRRILALGLAAPLIVGVITIIGAWTMFLSSHDTQFVIILTAASTVIATGLVQLLVAPLVRDLDRISEAASKIGAGDLTARTALSREDELGRLGVAFDDMAVAMQTQTAERERLEAERQFMLSSLSHDARTPLTAMRAAVEALQDGLAPDPERYLESIADDLRAIESIVENIFVIGKLDADQLQPMFEALDLAALAESAAIAIEPLARKHQTTIEVLASGTVDVRADRRETRRMIDNLLSNAIRHSPPSGSVKIIVHDEPIPTLTVRDQGPGFDPAFVDRAFEEFERADAARDRAHGGAGLGLAVVRGLAEAQGGRAWAEPGPGGRVSFQLPALVG